MSLARVMLTRALSGTGNLPPPLLDSPSQLGKLIEGMAVLDSEEGRTRQEDWYLRYHALPGWKRSRRNWGLLVLTDESSHAEG